ncbi:hypothetical protein FBU30_006692 [Linnemannia zychae]|nr:hypothetical protein FBU30_006692 [Linnemannia zychae]
MSHRRASTTSSISSFFDPSREIDSFASPVRGGMDFSEPHSSSSLPPASSANTRPPPAANSKPTSTLTSSLNNAKNNMSSQPVATASSTTTTAASTRSASSHSRNSSFSAATAGGAVPLSVSIPRQRSFSSSFSLATSGIPISAGAPSPRTFTGSSIISNPNSASFPGPANPFAMGAFAPLSPTSSSPPRGSSSYDSSSSLSSSVPVLHRRFSSSFNQLNQIVSPTSGSQGESSTMVYVKIRLLLCMSTSIAVSIPGGTPGHPLDRNDAGPTVVVTPQPSSNQQQQCSTPGSQDAGHHLTAVDKLKPSYDKASRSASPMRSMILNGQMLD